jgi:hypothetical protein
MKLVTRAAWGARKPRSVTPLDPDDFKGAAVHYTAMDADRVWDHHDCASRVRGVQRFHMDTRGWQDIAYNFLVCQHGYVFEGRGWGVRSAGQTWGNDSHVAVCFLGGDTARDDVTPAGRDALGEILRAIGGEVRPHSYFSATPCPGDELRGYIETGAWKITKPWPVPLPKWTWAWMAWKLRGSPKGERPKDAPWFIPPWAWLRLADLKRARV